MTLAARPIIYGAYAHPWLAHLCRSTGRDYTLADIPDPELDRLQALGVNWLWLIGAWQTGPYGKVFTVAQRDLRNHCSSLLSDFSLDDMLGSPYAVHDYRIHHRLGGDDALLKLRERLARRSIRLMLDYVPNHTACDHPWIHSHPERYICGNVEDLDARRGFFVLTDKGERVVRHGRDPYFDPWADTAQLDWRNPDTVTAMSAVVGRIAELCDGVRCDMAMLILNEVMEKTWGKRANAAADEPWSALVSSARARHSDFKFLAEVYWGLEGKLIELGIDWVYDKILYDRLRHDTGPTVREHLYLSSGIRARSLRFLENHDEDRAASAFSRGRHEAAAVIAATIPGPFFIHHGQLEGAKKKLPIQLGRAPAEPVNASLASFYERLLQTVREISGEWHPLAARPAWDGSATSTGFVSHAWIDKSDTRLITAVNFAPERGHAFLDLAALPLPEGEVTLYDTINGTSYRRQSEELRSRGLYVELPAFGAHLFKVQK